MVKNRTRIVPARRVRLSRGTDGWELIKQIDVPARPISPSPDRPEDASQPWGEAVDAHGVCIHRMLLDVDDDGYTEAMVPVDARIVALDIFDGDRDEPVVQVDLRGAGSGAPTGPRR